MTEPNELTPRERKLAEEWLAMCAMPACGICDICRAYLAATALSQTPKVCHHAGTLGWDDCVHCNPAHRALPPEMEERIPHAPNCLARTEFYGLQMARGKSAESSCNCFRAEILDTIRTLQGQKQQSDQRADARYTQLMAIQNAISEGAYDGGSPAEYIEAVAKLRAELSRLRAELEAANARITDRQIVIDQHNETIAGLEAAMVVRWEKIRALEAENAGLRKDKEKEC